MNSEGKEKLLEMAARIREMREIIGYSEEQMAEKTEVSVEEYRSVEAGKTDPTFNLLHQCAITFGADINALLKGHSAHLSGYEVTPAGQGPLTQPGPAFSKITGAACLQSLSFISSTKPSGPVTRTNGPNESSRITISVSSCGS